MNRASRRRSGLRYFGSRGDFLQRFTQGYPYLCLVRPVKPLDRWFAGAEQHPERDVTGVMVREALNRLEGDVRDGK